MYFHPISRNSDRDRHQRHSAKEPSHDNAEFTGESEVSEVWKRECEIQVVFCHHRRLAGEITRSPDGADLWEQVRGVWPWVSGVSEVAGRSLSNPRRQDEGREAINCGDGDES